jgi:hypothetical protein
MVSIANMIRASLPDDFQENHQEPRKGQSHAEKDDPYHR